MVAAAYWYGMSTGFIGICGVSFIFPWGNMESAVISLCVWLAAGLAMGAYGYFKKAALSRNDLKTLGLVLIVLPAVVFLLGLISWDSMTLAWDPIKLLALIGIPLGIVYLTFYMRSAARMHLLQSKPHRSLVDIHTPE